MFQNYFKIAWRNLKKNKVFSFINILGLSIGITCCLMIFLYINNEFSFDSFHKNGKNIYRVMRGYDKSKGRAPYLSPNYGPALLNDYPDLIKRAVRTMPTNALVTYNNHAFNEYKIYFTDPDFFTVFSFPLLKGNPETALKDPSSVVLTEKTAKKYFGNENPVGKIIELDKHMLLKVTGVAKDIPSNSHLEFSMIVPLANYQNADWFKGWLNNNLFVYVQLNDHATKAQVEKNFPMFMDKYLSKELERSGSKFDLALTPLSEIYFEPFSGFDNVKHGDKKVVYIFLSIAILILLIACINFMNLSTVRAVERSKEVGLRKVMGALRNNLIGQFIGESILLTSIACFIAFVLFQLLMPLYNQLLGYTLEVNWNTPGIYLFLLTVVIMVGFLAGSYPAFFLSSFSPTESLKGKLRLGKGGSFFRQALVVVQFSISVFLIIGTIVIMNQMHYVKSKELGFDKEQTVVVKLNNDEIYDHRVTFKHALEASPNIAGVSLMSGEPGGFFDDYPFKVEGQNDQIWKARTEFSDFEFAKTLNIKIIAGRDLSGQFATDTTDAVLINRTAAAKLGYTPERAIGKWIRNTFRDTANRKIVGVVEDFNFLSLKENMDALVISPSDDRRVAVIKLKSGNLQAGIAAIKAAYNLAAPVYPFEFTFLDQDFNDLYQADMRQQKILSIFSGLAIFIACLGLFGLASFTASKRTKEIGVRKVLGSSANSIVVLLTKDLLKPVVIAALITMPVAWYAMHQWLQNFAYRVNLQWWVFALAGFIAGLIAVVTVSYQAIKAAVANPINSLRSE
ncbi:ABC transporter permease [Danxiaibacter flavus]|uniref:ABC transporter permease n=1 Tax=Danxiaibacter flavus TaxID=3049108 RepID=A0ABV3ZD83_9BACT|nr:ABC transporter permease [Chitinophagaceae bacterium DXS]